MDDPIYYELKIISIETGTSAKCQSPKKFPSFKVSLELSFSWIIHAHMLQRLFRASVQLNSYNSFLNLLIHRICRLLSTCGFGWSSSHSGSTSYGLKRPTFAAHRINMEFSFTSRHSKSV
ncbi:uncharacterized protein TNCV_616931 [Trichonephila clavipes]|nr:uncharacterized protein TNCV_616931 [Trichonephila clavipes]